MTDTSLTTIEPSSAPIPNGYENYFDVSRWNQIGAIATAFSKSDLVPSTYKGNPANCFIAIHLGMRLGLEPFLAMTNIYVVQGNPALSAKLCISLANRSGIFDGGIVFQESGSGKDLSVTASAKLKANGVTVSKTMTFAQAQAAGWTNKPVWQSQPGQMLAYRTATQLIRLYAPDAILGMTTVEEWEDVTDTVQKRSYKKGEKSEKITALMNESTAEETPIQEPKSEEIEPPKPEPIPEPKKKNPITELLEKTNNDNN